MGREKSTIANIFYNSFGTIFYYGCQWLTTVLIVRMSGMYNAGVYATAMTFTAALSIFALYNTRQYQVSDVTGEYSDKTYISSRLIAVVIAVLTCGAALLFNNYNSYQWKVILIYMVFKCGEAVIDVFHGIDQKKERMDYVCYSFLIRGILMLASFCGFIYATGNLIYAITGMMVTTFLVAVFYDFQIAKGFMDKNERFTLSSVRRLMISLLPLVVVAVTNNLSISLPRYYLDQFYGSEIMGYFASVSTPAMILQVGAATIFIPLITPLATRYAANDRAGFVAILKKVAIVLGGLSFLAILASALLGDWFLVLIFGEELVPFTYLFVPVIIATLLISVNACLFPICTLFREIRGQLFVGVGGAVVSFAASVFFVRQFSMDGVVISLVITLIFQILIEIYLIYRMMKKWKGTNNG
ncbi:MAG: oligosaccharide flippase family protein [Lachnospiraceae bacterium]